MEIYIIILAYCGIFFVFIEIGQTIGNLIKAIKKKRKEKENKNNESRNN